MEGLFEGMKKACKSLSYRLIKAMWAIEDSNF